MLDKRVFDDELWVHVRECVQRKIRLYLVCVNVRVRVQKVNYSCN